MSRPGMLLLMVLLLLAPVAEAADDAGGLLGRADTAVRDGQLSTAEALLAEAQAAMSGAADQALFHAVAADIAIARGRPAEAVRDLEQALASAGDAGEAAIRVRLQGTLAVGRSLIGDHGAALAAAEAAATLADEAGLRRAEGRALGNWARIAIDAGDPATAEQVLERASTLAESLPPDGEAGFFDLNLGRTWTRLGDTGRHRTRALLQFERAGAIGRSTSAPRLESYAVGYTAELYESEARFEDALALYRRAAFVAQTAQADDILYLWEWGSARVLGGMGREAEAKASLERSVALLESLRHQLPFVYGQRGREFQETLEPIYFGLVAAELAEADARSGVARQTALRAARDTVEQLKAVELRNYFGDDCVERALARSAVDSISDSALVIYPIALPDRLVMLVNAPGGKLDSVEVDVTAEELDRTVSTYRRLLEKRITREYLVPAQALYALLIEPLEALLNPRIDTLIFVPHGSLNMVPMAALHDGRRHLIERFAVAVTPGLELTDPAPLSREDSSFLLAGLSQARDGFPPLSHVPNELESVAALGSGETLLDESFRLDRMTDALQSEAFNVLHIATHGEFGGETEESYLLTYDGRMEMAELERYVGLFRYRQQPLELLTLSACETASGDRRAALGLSGIAVKAGARSAVGSLWRVNDQSSAMLMNEFYGALGRPGTSRAKALQSAQQTLLQDLRYWHPGYWSAFLLISDWL
jgi:CHAT domain-containing protein